jgi:phenylpropionate dioxygenase-like ring-hydroxylating dioxygenase large terminal subunit
MLSVENNELLSKVGPQTPMGQFFRQFWLPVCLSGQMPEPDSDPVRIRLLAEDLVAFRNSNGHVGLLQEKCPHRGASLAIGRVEDCGIRCLYHGWKFGIDGAIQDLPNHDDPRFKERLKARSYPVREAGGLVWTYLGPAAKQPQFTRYAFMDAPEENRTIFKLHTAVNYLQMVEGGFDSSHVSILHSDAARPGWLEGGFTPNLADENPGALSVNDLAPRVEVRDTDFGFYSVAVRAAGVDEDDEKLENMRVVPFIYPSTRIIPAPSFMFTVFETPADDTNNTTHIVIHGSKPADREAFAALLGLDDPAFWSETDNRFKATWDNRFGQDRAKMKRHWTGLSGIEQEDAVIALSMGPLVDRSQEHLVPADRVVIHLRKRLLECATQAQKGEEAATIECANLTDVSAHDETHRAGYDWCRIVPHHGISPEAGPAQQRVVDTAR